MDGLCLFASHQLEWLNIEPGRHSQAALECYLGAEQGLQRGIAGGAAPDLGRQQGLRSWLQSFNWGFSQELMCGPGCSPESSHCIWC